MLSQKRHFKLRKIQHASFSARVTKPQTLRPLKIIQHNYDATQEIKIRPSPVRKTHQTESVQAVAPIKIRAAGQPTIVQRRVLIRQIGFSKVPATLSQTAFFIEVSNSVLKNIYQRPDPTSSQTTISPETGSADQQAVEPFTSPTTSQTKLAALPRKLPQSPPAVRDGSDADLNGLRGLFTGQVRQRIANAKYYPRMARRRGMEGQPVIAFTLDKGGRLMEVDLAQTSGYQLLDQAALKAVHQAAPYPEIPAELKTDTFQFKLPISFVLK
jgi:TonB family protein